jgi:DUF438 domain-containing protein
MDDNPSAEKDTVGNVPGPSPRAGGLPPDIADLVLGHLPLDLSFADAENKLIFWQGGLFADCDPSLIGSDLDECHGPRSQEIIARMLLGRRAGRRDEALFWAREDSRLILSRYVAVRDAQGVYRGVLETMQDITDLQSISGERHDLV